MGAENQELTGEKGSKDWEDLIVKSDFERASDALGCQSEIQKIP
jgi:hypothetical protein